jgi:hypothetical protein
MTMAAGFVILAMHGSLGGSIDAVLASRRRAGRELDGRTA